MWKPVVLGLGASFAFATAALADVAAFATTDLNMRAGPGPEYPVVSVISASDAVTVMGCIDGSKWCMVAYNGMTGWSYSDYLAASAGSAQVVLADRPATLPLPNVVFSGQAVSNQAFANAPVITAAPPATGTAIIASLTPPPAVRTYVIGNPATNVYLNGEIVVGAMLPQDVTIVPVPQYQYAYVTVNGLPVLVDPMTRRVVYIFRG